jgi:DNA-binding CsgD family transcriptional regulator
MSRSRAFRKVNRRPKAEEVFKDRIDLIRCRAELLKGKDGALVQMYLDNTGTFRQMARLAGVNEANVARRIHKLIKRLLDGQYITCLQYRDRLTQEQIEIARDYFVDGLPMREIAYRHEISYYAVRQAVKEIQRLTAVNRKEGD